MEITQATTAELIDFACEAADENSYWYLIAELHQRGSLAEFDAAAALAQSATPRHREIACDILGQLGWDQKICHADTLKVLINLLQDPEELVVASAAFALGHRNDSQSIEPLLPLQTHNNPLIRLGVTGGLSALEDPRAIAALIALASDEDREVKNWATFGLASRCEFDSEDLRQVLLKNTASEDYEIRGESLIGLARRKDQRVIQLILQELQGDLNGSWVIEACALFGQPQYYEYLQTLQQKLGDDVDPRFAPDIERALQACSSTSVH